MSKTTLRAAGIALLLTIHSLATAKDGYLLNKVVGVGIHESNSSMLCRQPPYAKYRLFRVPITDIRQGDILSISADFQVTGERTILGDENIMVSSEIILGYTIDDLVGIRLAENTGQNFRTTDEHHFRTVRIATWIADADYPEMYLLVLSWCAIGADKTGRITVDEGMGQMITYIYRAYQ